MASSSQMTNKKIIKNEFSGAFSSEMDTILEKLTDSVIKNYSHIFSQPLIAYFDIDQQAIIIKPERYKTTNIKKARDKIEGILKS